MDWIKRNLFFVIGATVALVLMIGAGIYTWSGWSNNAKAQEEITAKYEELKRLTNLEPNPGSGKVDNVKTARDQQQQLGEITTRVATRYEPVLPIPAGPETNVTADAFTSGLSTTIRRLQNEATNAGVNLPPRYNFSFEKQSSAVKFAGSVAPLAVQLGEVSTLVDILIAAKVNSLDSIQRERVTPDDLAGPATDYLELHSETNELAVLTPYQITFRSFTPELALALCGFASSSHGIIVKSINVELSGASYGGEAALAPTAPIYPYPQPINPPPGPRGRYGEESDGFRQRYGVSGRAPPPVVQPAPVYAQPVAAPVSTTPRTVLDEKQLKITMLVQVVKLLPKK